MHDIIIVVVIILALVFYWHFSTFNETIMMNIEQDNLTNEHKSNSSY